MKVRELRGAIVGFSGEKEFEFPSNAAALAAKKALSAELGKGFEKRAASTINTNKNLVLLRVVAEDGRALGASLGSFSRMIVMCREIAFTEE